MDIKFNKFKRALQNNFREISKNINYLFEVDVDKDELWSVYLDSFPEGTNNIFRERRAYDCSSCRQFIKNFGNVVIIKNNKINTIWDLNTNSTTFQPVVNALDKYIKSHVVTDIYVSKIKKIGIDKNYEKLENGGILEWQHLYLELPDRFINRSDKSIGDIKGSYRDTRNVFKRSLEEISEEAILTILELISSNTLYKGKEWESVLNEFLKHKKVYDKLHTQQEKELYTWEQSVIVGGAIGRIKNHSIGTLLINITEGMDLDTAVRKYEKIIAPENYKRPKPIYSKKMLEEAKNTIEKLGYMDSLNRRYATLDDITINNILFSNKDAAKKIIGTNIFDEMANDLPINIKKFSRVEEISIDNFITNILPSTKELEVLLENKHNNNMVSLIASKNKDSKIMFKWNNNFGWAYSGNITDSSMKENVKSAGGKVDGVLRFSIQWNDDKDYNPNDFDAHCIEPNGYEIYFGDDFNRTTKGTLDIDIRFPRKGEPAVENITWPIKSLMKPGLYKFFVHNYSHNGGKDGFKAEIEFNGQIYSFEYDKELKQHEDVQVAEVILDSHGEFTIKEKLPSNLSSKELWNLKTNQFIPVSVIMLSPNYWDEQKGIGNKHYFFMLKDCINPEQPSGFYNEFLKEDLREHRKVFEALGSKLRVEDTENQLSGLGFSSTKRNELLVKVKGNIERVLKIKF